MKRIYIALIAIHLVGSILGCRINSPKIQELINKGKPDDNAVTEIYHNILIGELFPSGNVYLERFSLDGGADCSQHFERFTYSEEIAIHPIKKAKWASVKASFSRLIKATYIGETEKDSRYFNYPFSEARQDALLYKVEKKTTDVPMTVVSFNKYQIEKVIYFGGSDIREYSHKEYEAAMNHIRDDHERKDKYDSTLSKIQTANTILGARKIALCHIKNVDHDVLLSVYETHGIEYASTVYVIDFILNGTVILTKEKWNTDGPY